MKLDDLEKLAKDATPGPWQDHNWDAMERPHVVAPHIFKKSDDCCHGQADTAVCRLREDAAFIAAHNPERMQRIYALLRECREVLMSGTSYDEAKMLAKLEEDL